MSDLPDNPQRRGVLASLMAELRRRRVHRTAAIYLAGALAAIGYGNDILENLGAPAAVAKWLTIVLIAGFPVAVAAAWAYDLRVSRDRSNSPDLPYAAGARGALILAGGILVGMGLLGTVAFLTRGRSLALGAPAESAPQVGVLPIQLEDGEDAAWLTRALEGSITDALSASRGVTMRTQDIVEAYAHLPLDSLAHVLDLDYAVSARLATTPTESRLTLQVLDSAGTVVGSAASITAGPPAREAAEELTRQARDYVLHTLGAKVRTAAWRFGTRSESALNLLYQADDLVSQAKSLLSEAGGAKVAGGVLDQADAHLLQSVQADPHWAVPALLRARVAALKAYALLIDGGPGKEVRAALDTGMAISSKLLEREPANAQALALRGMLAHRIVVYIQPAPGVARHLLAAAEEDLHAALRYEPNLAMAAAELSGLLYEQARFAEASRWAERALQADAYLADADGITNRLAMATFEAGGDTTALRLCHDAIHRFGSAFHHGCVIEVLAFGDVPPDIPDAWEHLASLRADQLLSPQTVAYYEAQVAAVLARAGQTDSARRVLARVRAAHPAEFRTPDLQALEAAVRFRMGETDTATALLRSYSASGNSDVDFKLSRRALKPYRPLLVARQLP